ncbi:MAG TPA: peptidoglycan editing factor PgeF [Casimicrobiaceae bacterium]|nr:peptidoglycan editing factor PgeF [Casimicrobiaceae bacterium]
METSDVRTTAFDVGGPRAPADSRERATIAGHRRFLERLLPSPPAWLDQVHGADVVTLERSPCLGDDAPCADAAVTRKHDVVLAIRVADCMPVLFASADGAAIGVAHAGWRGLAAGVLERTIDAMRCAPAELIAWIGPCISAAAYEVGDDVYDAFVRRDDAAASAFERSAPGKWHADLVALALQRLAQSGVVNVTLSGFCTASDSQRFFSFRRDGATGRMAALIWRTEC